MPSVEGSGTMIMALRRPDLSDSRFPAPMPTLEIVKDLGLWQSLAAAANAAPVGVTYSPAESVTLSGSE